MDKSNQSLLQIVSERAQTFPTSILRILLVGLLIKFILSAILPMTTDESYYWVWSHRLQLSYFDHPAMVAWLFWLGHPFEIFLSAVRWPGVLLSQATLFIWLIILRPLFSDRQLELWLWLALFSPMIGAGALIITPDIPLLFFWSLTLFVFIEWVKNASALRTLLMGLLCGLGFVGKYMMILQPAFLCLAALIYKPWRGLMIKWAPLILVGILIGSSPVWIWNYLNNWVSFRFQADHGLGEMIWKPEWTYGYVLAEIAIIFPTILILFWRGRKLAPLWMSVLAWSPLLFFLLTSFRGNAEANWPIAAYPSIFAIAVLGASGREKWIMTTVKIWGFALAVIYLLIWTRWTPTGEPIKTKEFYEFENLVPIAREHLGQVYARNYQMAAKLSFELRSFLPKLRFMNRTDFYDFLPESLPKDKHFYFLAEKTDGLPAYYVDRGFKITSRQPIEGTNIFELWEISQ